MSFVGSESGTRGLLANGTPRGRPRGYLEKCRSSVNTADISALWCAATKTSLEKVMAYVLQWVVAGDSKAVMSHDRNQLLEEAALILFWETWFCEISDNDGRRARQMRMDEISLELGNLIVPHGDIELTIGAAEKVNQANSKIHYGRVLHQRLD